jgi:hypothetical protein
VVSVTDPYGRITSSDLEPATLTTDPMYNTRIVKHAVNTARAAVCHCEYGHAQLLCFLHKKLCRPAMPAQRREGVAGRL